MTEAATIDAAAAKPFRGRFSVSVVPAVFAEESGAAGEEQPAFFPPRGEAYGSRENPETIYLWRWIGMHAPDWVVDVRSGAALRWTLPKAPPVDRVEAKGPWRLAAALKAGTEAADSAELIAALSREAPCDVAPVPALRVELPPGASFLPQLLAEIERNEAARPSAARREMQRRLERSALQIATDLGRHYGHELDRVAYIPALALIGRTRLTELTGEGAHLADVERVVRPYLEGRTTLPERPGGSNLSGHLIFSHLARVTRKAGYTRLARVAANLGFDAGGKPRDTMPHHSEMSDAVFMGGPILAEVGRLTGESKYFEMCLRHVRTMSKLNVREDGLHRHSPLDPTAWGRGNGFPALGLALCLSAFPDDHPGRPELEERFRKHLEALLPHQDYTGCWHQVVDHPESYRELTSTCMITFAMLRGVRLGILDASKYRPPIERAWRAIQTRIGRDGRLVDVCTGTGKQRSLRAYLDRKAILGRDARGGAMALMVSTEMAAWSKDAKE